MAHVLFSVLTCLYIYPFFDQWTNGFVGFLKVLVIGFAHQFSFFFLSRLISFIMRSFPDTPGFFLVSLRPLETWVTKSMYFLLGLFLCVWCACLHVCRHTCVQVPMHVYEHACGGQRLTSHVFLDHFPACSGDSITASWAWELQAGCQSQPAFIGSGHSNSGLTWACQALCPLNHLPCSLCLILPRDVRF